MLPRGSSVSKPAIARSSLPVYEKAAKQQQSQNPATLPFTPNAIVDLKAASFQSWISNRKWRITCEARLRKARSGTGIARHCLVISAGAETWLFTDTVCRNNKSEYN